MMVNGSPSPSPAHDTHPCVKAASTSTTGPSAATQGFNEVLTSRADIRRLPEYRYSRISVPRPCS
jgi:hypothetical protein